jgi:hypothetical protein
MGLMMLGRFKHILVPESSAFEFECHWKAKNVQITMDLYVEECRTVRIWWRISDQSR